MCDTAGSSLSNFLICCNAISSDASIEEDIVEEDQQADEDEDGDPEDEMAGFIVDEDEIDANGQVVKYGLIFHICANFFYTTLLDLVC